ncbi:MAG: GntR family transcriptional regulator [Anaerolineae bacterium]
MDLSFQIDHKSGIPIYIQIMEQIKHLLATGALQSGQQLPTIRQLAVDLTINLHTVAHAYAELEREGFLTIQRGRGTFITNGHLEHEDALHSLRNQKLQALVTTMLAEAVNLGYDPKEVEEALQTHVAEWHETTNHTAGQEGED